MSELKFYELKCRRCGGELQPLNGNMYRCISCGRAFKEQIVEDVADTLRKVLDEQKQEAIANLRQQLWAEMHEQYINSAKIVGLARDIKKYLPEDYFANFCEVANSGNDSQVSAFLNNTSKADMADYADVVLDFMLKSVTAANLNAISLFIERAFKGDTENYYKYITAYEREAQKVNSGIYELIITRDVFLAYSSADIEKVLELCDYLESNKITCFLALRNLRHGRGAVDNYDQALKTAIDNCKTVVFVSSCNSRDTACDALMRELPYIKQKDIESAPAEYRRAYDRMPAEYMMPRVEYLIEDYEGGVAEVITKEFFHGLEWCKNKEDVANRVMKYLTEEHETAAQKAEKEKRQFQQQLEEERRRAEEERRKTKELELKIAEARRGTGTAASTAAAGAISTGITANSFIGSKLCKKCKKQNSTAAKFCPDCGSNEFFETYEDYLASKIKFCVKCGAQNNVEDKFCIECGSKEFVPTKKEYEEIAARRAEEERLRKQHEEELRRNPLIIGDYKNIGGGYVTFGSYPQSKKAADVKIGELFDKERNYYLGSDGCLYAVWKGEYYKVEPIRWKVLENDGAKFVVADDILDVCRFAESDNNYAKSKVRQFLNNDFYNRAFTDSQKNLIITTIVDNSASSTVTSGGIPGVGYREYYCGNTNDKVFLLSSKEATQFFKDDESLKRVPTEYELAKGAEQYTGTDSRFLKNGKGCGKWWLRSPYNSNFDYRLAQCASECGSFGTCRVDNSVSEKVGVVPALKFSLSEVERVAYEEKMREKESKRIEQERKKILLDYEIKDGVLARYKGKGTNIVIPDNVKIIGQGAFYNCRTLTNVTIGDNVTEISHSVFLGCGNLISIYIGKNVTKMGSDVFTHCFRLNNISVDVDNKSIKSFAGNLYTRDGRVLIKYASGKTESSFSILDGVKTIAGSAFNSCNNLSFINFPATVTSIGDSAFSNTKISTIVIPYGITHMGKNVFSGCTSLHTICCCDKKPLFGLPAGWDKDWLGGCSAKVIWNWKL